MVRPMERISTFGVEDTVQRTASSRGVLGRRREKPPQTSGLVTAITGAPLHDIGGGTVCG